VGQIIALPAEIQRWLIYIWIVDIWTVKTGLWLRLGLGFLLGLDLGLGLVLGFELVLLLLLLLVFRLGLGVGLGLVMTVQFMTVQIKTGIVVKRLDASGWIKMPFGMAVYMCRPRPHCVKWEPSSPIRGTAAPKFRPVSIVAKWLHGSKCHLVRR